ncbi:MAG: undecaprenyl-diphosphatase UppP [Candidatus Saganbacteria bacterium]|nr:undecaprenyl-diphosphatase UppP [Candidatus Saganbacteria bacterium]
MSILQAVFLGIVQGLTEFLPISSSAHLTIFQYILGIPPDIPFDVTVHLATLFAVLLYFWKDILNLIAGFFNGLLQLAHRDTIGFKNNRDFYFSILVIIATIPTALMGFLFKDFFESLFSSLLAIGCFLILTGILIVLAEWRKRGDKQIGQVFWWDAVIIGVGQGCAIAPGLSRSGTTISTSLFRGFNRELAARFSFILSIPAIFGAFLLQLKDVAKVGMQGSSGGLLLVGFIAALISGYLAIKVFMRIIEKTSIRGFAYYCFVVGALVVLYSLYISLFFAAL